MTRPASEWRGDAEFRRELSRFRAAVRSWDHVGQLFDVTRTTLQRWRAGGRVDSRHGLRAVFLGVLLDWDEPLAPAAELGLRQLAERVGLADDPAIAPLLAKYETGELTR